MNSKSILATVALVFCITRAVANPQVIPFYGDDESRITTNRVYTHALDLGDQGGDPFVNGVQFKSVNNGNNGSHNGYGWRGVPPNPFPFQTDKTFAPLGSGIANVLGDFCYGISNNSIYLDNLTPGIVYEARFYHRFFGGGRPQTLTFIPGPGIADEIDFDPDAHERAEMVVYRYTAGATSLQVHCYSKKPGDTYHISGLVNEVVYEVEAAEATQQTAITARLNGAAIIGGAASTVTAYWQPSSATDWDTAEEAGVVLTTDGAFHLDIGGLVPETAYRFRFLMTNGVSTAWSDAGVFATTANVPAFEIDAAAPTGTTATFNGTLLFCGGGMETVDMTLLWGTDPEALDGAPVVLTDVAPGPFTMSLSGLDFGATYYFRFVAENADGAETRQAETGSFTTLGAPVLGAVGARKSAAGTLELSVAISTQGAGPMDVTCWFGTSPENMASVATWQGEQGTPVLTHTEDGLQPGVLYHYAFEVFCAADETTSWTVWSATNTALVAYIHEAPRVTVFQGDAESEISTTKRYTHLLDVGGTLNYPVVNGVRFHSTADVAGSVNGYSWANLPGNLHNGGNEGQISAPQGSGMRALLTDFRHSAANTGTTPRALTFGGLKPGFLYEFRFYDRPWDTPNDRGQTFTFKPLGASDPGWSIAHNPDAEKNDHILSFRYAPAADTLIVEYVQTAPSDNSYHIYGLSNEILAGIFEPAAQVGNTYATLNASVLLEGSSAIVSAFWDTQPRASNEAEWANQLSQTVHADGTVNFDLTGLTGNSTYYFRFKMESSFGTAWTDAVAFTTHADTPVVETLAADLVTERAATARADLLFTGGPDVSADVLLLWDTTDHADTSAWRNTNSVPAQSSGVILVPLTGLWYDTTYHYRAMAVNAAGSVWASSSTNFTTRGIPIFGNIANASPTPNQLQMDAEVVYPGPVEGTVTCWFGTDPDLLASVGGDTLDAPGTVNFTQSNLQVGGVYYYAFQIESSVSDGGQSASWDVWSATNRVVLSGATEWTAGGGSDTDWDNPANWSHGVPGPGGTAAFPAGDVLVTVSRDIAIANVNVLGNGVTFDLGQFTLNVTGIFTVGVNVYGCAATLASGRLHVAELIVGNGCSNCRFTVAAGAELVATSTTTLTRNGNQIGNELIVRGLFLANGINIGDGGGWGGSDKMTVDGGCVTNQIATNIGPWSGSHTLELLNNARFVQASDTFRVGYRGSNCRLHVFDGSELDITGNVTVNIGTDWGGSVGYITVSNAALRVTGSITVGQGNSGGGNTILLYEDPGYSTIASFGGNFHVQQGYNPAEPGNYSNNHFGIHGGTLTVGGEFAYADSCINNRIHISRPNSRLSANVLNLRGSSSLTYDLAAGDTFDHTVWNVAGAAAFSANTLVNVSLGRFKGTATLFSSATGDLNPNVITVDQTEGYNHKLIVAPNLLKIRAWINRTLFILR